MVPFEQAIRAVAVNHSKLNFAEYLKALSILKVTKYVVTLQPHTAFFESASGETTLLPIPSYDIKPPASEWRPEILKEAISQAQAGAINYHTFCQKAGEAGVHRYIVDFTAHLTDYRSGDNSQSHIENIPAKFFILE